MEITVNIPDEVAEKARALGMSPESYVARLVVGERNKPEPQLSTEERLANLRQFFRDMTKNSNKIPHLSDEALSRESFYQDRD
jgi:DNA-binding ferritin-like protein